MTTDRPGRRRGARPGRAAWLWLLVPAAVLVGCGTGRGTTLDPQAQAGRRVAEQNGCASCHSTDGSRKLGPSWKGIWGTAQPLAGGGSATVDRAYIAESVRDPGAAVVAGYPSIMPRFSLSEQDIDDVAAYIRALGDGKGGG